MACIPKELTAPEYGTTTWPWISVSTYSTTAGWSIQRSTSGAARATASAMEELARTDAPLCVARAKLFAALAKGAQVFGDFGPRLLLHLLPVPRAAIGDGVSFPMRAPVRRV